MTHPVILSGAIVSAVCRGRNTRRGSHVVAAILIGALCGCASSSEDIQAQYVSPMQYASYDCQQIAAEQQRVSARVGQLAGKVDDNAAGDAVAVGVGLILFWPALFFVDGDGPEAAEYAKLKGEHEALQKVSAEKNCGTATAAAAGGAGGTTALASAPTGGADAGTTGRTIVVTPTVKAKVDRHIRNCKAQSTNYCVIAVRNDGTSVGLGKGEAFNASRVEQAGRTAMRNCGGASECVIVYEGGKMRMDVISQ